MLARAQARAEAERAAAEVARLSSEELQKLKGELAAARTALLRSRQQATETKESYEQQIEQVKEGQVHAARRHRRMCRRR